MPEYRPLDVFLPRSAFPPIDLARSIIFLFRRDGERVLWASDAARRFLGVRPNDDIEGRRLGPLLPSTQRLRFLGEVLQAGSPPRLERIPFFVNLRSEPLTCVCRIVPLRSGEEALLLTAKEVRIPPGAPAPELSPVEARITAIAESRARAELTPSASEPDIARAELVEMPARRMPAIGATGAWSAPNRDSLRFTFDSNLHGVIEAVSSEFAKAVGPLSADVVGQSWHAIAEATGEPAAVQLAAYSSRAEAFRSLTLPWPMDDGRRVPVEISGTPRVHKGVTLGLRGFGLVRLADAVLPEVVLPEAILPEAILPEVISPDEISPQEISPQEISPQEILPEVNLTEQVAVLPEADPAVLDDATAADEVLAAEISARQDVVAPEAPAPEMPAPESPAPEAAALPDFVQAESDPPGIGRIVNAVQAVLGEPGANPARVSSRLGAGELDRLTQQERHAFREIARALGARFEGDLEEERSRSVAETTVIPEEQALQEPAGPELAEAEPVSSAMLEEIVPVEPDETVPVSALEEADQPAALEAEPVWTEPEELAGIEVAGIEADVGIEADAEVEADDLPPEAAADRSQLALLDRLPIGILVLRANDVLFMNATLLGLIGLGSVEAFETEMGVETLFDGPVPDDHDDTALSATRLRRADGSLVTVDAHLQLTSWEGEPASVFSFRRARPELVTEAAPVAPVETTVPRVVEDVPLAMARGGGNAALEAQLRAREAELAEYRAMLDTATDGVISLASDGRMLATNRPVEALFGYDASELIGERLTKLFASESHAAVADYLDGLNANGLQSILAEGRSVYGRESKGGRIPLFLTIGRVSSSGKLCAVLRDLSSWKKVEADLTDARKAADIASQQKSQFLAKISHEIRTPMNSIIGFAEVMMDQRFGPIGNDRYADYLKDIHRSGQHVVSLVNDLLDLSKIEAGKADLTFGSVNLNDVVASCVSMMEPQALREKVFLRMQLDAALPHVVADERSIRQIVINLLSNSAKFNKPGGQIIVSTTLSAEREAVIRVRDTGIGMSDDELALAMQPFRQVPTSGKLGGTGLGLPLTKALTEANRASLRISSQRGEGTMAEVVFPATRVLAE